MDKLWAPWRIEYIRNPGKGCFLCEALRRSEMTDALILEKRDLAFTIMNRYPYNNGHMMVAPIRHVGVIESLNDEEFLQISNLITRTIRALTLSVKPQGFNIGINQGRIAGAGVIDHIHVHLVPRWQGDTNYMPVLADTKVVSDSLNNTYRLLKEALEKIDTLK